jgi:hypothetical protein
MHTKFKLRNFEVSGISKNMLDQNIKIDVKNCLWGTHASTLGFGPVVGACKGEKFLDELTSY